MSLLTKYVKRRWIITGLTAVALLHGSLGGTQPVRAAEGATVVFAAASLKNALDEITKAYGGQTGKEVTVSYAASSALAKQIEAGAPAGLFISADIPWMDYLAERDLIDPASRVDLLSNELILVTSADSGLGKVDIADRFDLAGMLGDGRLAVGQVESVPAGKYAKAALQSLNIWSAIEPKLAQTDNVRAALALVAQGEAPLGIVYASDAISDPKVKVLGTFPASSHPPIIYPAAVIKEAASPDANGFLAFLSGPVAKAAFTRQGFKVLAGPAS